MIINISVCIIDLFLSNFGDSSLRILNILINFSCKIFNLFLDHITTFQIVVLILWLFIFWLFDCGILWLI